MTTAQVNLRLQKIVTAIAVLLFLIKIAAWYITDSVAILTDALESIVNVVAGFISLYSLYVASLPRDENHPYGHGKAEFVSAAVEGSLVLVAGLYIIYKAVSNLIEPQPLQKLDLGILLITVTAFINFATGWVCVRTGKKNDSAALVASGKHLQSDTYTTIGIIAGLILIYLFDWRWLDGAFAILFALIIIFTGYKIIRSSLAGIMDEADKELLKKIVALLNQNRKENWIDLHNLRIIKFGNILHLDCHLTVPWYLNVRQAHIEVDALSNLVKNEFAESVELNVHLDGCLDFSCRICDKPSCEVRRHSFERKVEWTIENISTDNKHHL